MTLFRHVVGCAATVVAIAGCSAMRTWRWEGDSHETRQHSQLWQLEHQLKRGDPTERQRAASLLLSREGGLSTLRRALLDASAPAAQHAVLKAIARTGDDGLASEVVRLALSSALETMRLARQALAATSGERVGKALGRVIGDTGQPTRTRLAAIEIVRVAPYPGTAPALVNAIEDSDPRVRAAALGVLEWLTGRKLGADPNAWRQWLANSRDMTRGQWLLESIADLRRRLDELAQTRDQYRAEAAAQTVEALSLQPESTSRSVLLDALKSEHAAVRAYAARELARKKEAGRETLSSLMSDDSPEVRASAIEAIGGLGDTANADVLLRALRDPAAVVRQCAARALGGLPPAKAGEALLSCLGDADPDVRTAAAEALGAIGDRNAVPSLCERLRDASPSARVAAAAALGKLKDTRAVAPLCQAANDASERVRWYVADSLGRLQAVSAMPTLLKLAKDLDARVRESATVALGKLGSPQTIGRLVEALKDADERVRAQAADALDAVAAGHPAALLRIADAFYAARETKRAVAAYERWQKQFPQEAKRSVSARRRLAKCYLSVRDWAKAAAMFEGLLVERRTDVDLRVDLSQCLWEAKRFDRLLDLSSLWLKELPDHGSAWWSNRLRVVQAHASQQRFAKVVELVNAFEGDDAALGGEPTRSALTKLRADAQAKLAGGADDGGGKTENEQP